MEAKDLIEKLRFGPSIDESNIKVAIKGDNIVVLGGKVETYLEKRFAEEAVENYFIDRSVKSENNAVYFNNIIDNNYHCGIFLFELS